MGDDIGWMQPSIYHRGLVVGETPKRAGLYQTKNGLLVFLGSLRSRKSMTSAEISSSCRKEDLS